jgi:hypothetical protein
METVTQFKTINGNKYVKQNDKVVCIEDISRHPPYDEKKLYPIKGISKIFILDDFLEILQRLPITSLDIYRVYSKNGELIPTKEGISKNNIWVQVHWEDYEDFDGNDSTIVDFNCLGIRFNQSRGGKGINKLYLDDNTFMRKIVCSVNPFINDINSKLPSTSKKSIIYIRVSSGKTDDETSLSGQFECGCHLTMILGLIIYDVFIGNGISAGSKGKEPPNLKQNNFKNCINQPGYNTLIVKYPNRLTRSVSGFVDLFFNNLKPRGINIIAFDNNNKLIDSSKDDFLMNLSNRNVSIIKDRENYRKNSLPDGLYMSIILKSVWLRLINKAEEEYENNCKMAQQTADYNKKRKIEKLDEDDNLKAIEEAFKSKNKDKIITLINTFKARTGYL